jgi:type II restriction endonuclease EcoO109I-like protein
MIYTLRGVRRLDDWVNRVLEDKETSAIEGHIGTFLEEVARIVSGGIKPGSGVDLQVDGDDDVVHLYALQTAGNTKNAGSKRSDIDALKRAARPLRAARRHVEMNIAVLHGRATTGTIGSEPDISVLASDEFWGRISGVADFRARLLKASLILARLVQSKAGEEVERIKEEARELFSDDKGELAVGPLANPTVRTAKKTRVKTFEE